MPKSISMPHSLTEVYLHLVWATKHKHATIDDSIKSKLYAFLEDELIKLGCSVLKINGTEDHVHCLIRIRPHISISIIVKQIKGSSSRYINKNNLIEDHFEWQRGYYVNSIHKSEIGRIVNYIENQ